MPGSIRAAVVGLNEPAGTILAGLGSTAGLKVVGLADADRERLEKEAEAAIAAGND